MIIQEILRRINFKIGTWDDISGRAINPIVSNQVIIDELNSQLNQYANITKGIQDVFSFSLNRNDQFREAPSLALRSEAYFYIYVISNGVIFAVDMRGQRDVYKTFIFNPINGITNWMMAWNAGKKPYLGVFPNNSLNAKTTTLTANITAIDTTIPVVDTTGFVSRNGRFTLGTEVVEYQYKDATNFYGCNRGQEMSDASLHSSGDILIENNIIIYYSRLAQKVILNDEQLVPQQVLERELEIVEEHVEGIIKAVAYNILIKLDPERANVYKVDYLDLYEQYRQDIKKGYYIGRQGTNFDDPNLNNESGIPYATNLQV
jgi:hypothetical protein